MLASPGVLPDRDDHSWSYEVKWDGMRVLATCSRGRLRLTGRSGTDVTSRFPELVEATPEHLPEGSVVDGEVVLLDAAGKPSFSLLAPRIQKARAGAGGVRPVSYLAFDVLRVGGDEVLDRTYDDRRALLRDLVTDGARISVPGSFDDGTALLASTVTQGLEGVVAKRRRSRYRPGVRSPDWVKVPNRRTMSVVIGGWKSRADTPSRLASLLVGTPTDDGLLRYEGAVGSGLSDPESRTVLDVLRDIATEGTPFHGYPAPEAARGDVLTWVEPLLVVDVEHLGRTANALLRQPTIVRLRPDLSYHEVVDGEGS
jgi:bifunctional non-homologous end joining protein LigD